MHYGYPICLLYNILKNSTYIRTSKQGCAMALFEVSTKKLLSTSQLNQGTTPRHNRRLVLIRVFIGMTIVSILTTLVITKGWYGFLILMPVSLTIVFTPSLLLKIA